MKTVIYKTTFKNPSGALRVYIGIHKCDSNHPLWSREHPTGYIGSSGIAQQKFENGIGHSVLTLKQGWTHIDTVVVHEIDDLNYSIEDDFIRSAWREFGVAPEARRAAALHKIDLSEFKDGICINVQTSNLSALQDELVREKSVKTRRETGKLNKWQDARHSKESAIKSLHTRLSNGSHQRALDSAHSSQSRDKARSTMLAEGKYKESTRNAIASAWSPEATAKRSATRIGKRPKYKLSDGFVGDYAQCSVHIGCSSGTFSNWVSGRRPLAPKYGKWDFIKL